MILIYEAIVGSKLHGLDTPTSDEDHKGVYMGTLKDELSIFSRVPENSHIGRSEDTSYDLRKFMILAMKGNPTILECLFSDLVIHNSPVMRELQNNWKKIFNTHAYVSACMGYAKTQHRKADLKNAARQGKLATAEVRVLSQGITFLETGEIVCKAPDEYHDLMMEWKARGDVGVSQAELEKYSKPLVARIKELEPKTKFDYVPDSQWVDDFLYRSYTKY